MSNRTLLIQSSAGSELRQRQITSACLTELAVHRYRGLCTTRVGPPMPAVQEQRGLPCCTGPLLWLGQEPARVLATSPAEPIRCHMGTGGYRLSHQHRAK